MIGFQSLHSFNFVGDGCMVNSFDYDKCRRHVSSLRYLKSSLGLISCTISYLPCLITVLVLLFLIVKGDKFFKHQCSKKDLEKETNKTTAGSLTHAEALALI